MLFRLTIFLVLPLSAAIAAAAPDVREPTAKWVVDFADAQCVATRAYGTAEKPLHLVLKAPPLGNVMQVAVVREAGWTNAAQVKAQIGIGEQPPLGTNMLMYSPKKGGLRVHMLNMPLSDFSPARQAKSLAIRSGSLDETFALSGMGPLLKIMEQCVTNLRKVWNIADFEGDQSTLPKRASADMVKFFKSDDYPAQAMAEKQTGAVKFAVLVDESGRVADCTIIETSGVAVLDAQSCAIVKERAKFQPAIGTDGKPSKDALISKVSWKLPR